jgi:molybdopterin-guanine dinucleotide biosynthesis protein A
MKPPVFDAIVLAGGSARRLGGVDKAAIVVGGSTLFERALGAVAGAKQIVAVGPRRTTSIPALWIREDPVDGGPVAGLNAGLSLVDAPVVVVLAVDTPFVTEALVRDLVRASTAERAALVTGRGGRPQPLIAAYPTELLRRSLASLENAVGASMNQLLEGIPYEVIVDERAAFDCDTWADVVRAREIDAGASS